MDQVERSPDVDRRLGEYWDKYDITSNRLAGALKRAKEDMSTVLTTFEAFLQGELAIHDMDTELGSLANLITCQRVILQQAHDEVMDAIRDRVERLENGS